MALKLIEGAVDAVKTYLTNNLATKVSAINTEYNDGILIENMKSWYIEEQKEVPEFPVCIVLGHRGRPEGEGEGWMKAAHTIDLIIMATDQNTETLRRKLFRYIRSLIELMKTARSTIGYQIEFGDWDFSDVYAAESSFLSGAKLTIFLKKYENS